MYVRGCSSFRQHLSTEKESDPTACVSIYVAMCVCVCVCVCVCMCVGLYTSFNRDISMENKSDPTACVSISAPCVCVCWGGKLYILQPRHLHGKGIRSHRLCQYLCAVCVCVCVGGGSCTSFNRVISTENQSDPTACVRSLCGSLCGWRRQGVHIFKSCVYLCLYMSVCSSKKIQLIQIKIITSSNDFY